MGRARTCRPIIGYFYLRYFRTDVEMSCLDKFWMHQDVKYDFAAGLTGIGDRSQHEISGCSKLICYTVMIR